MREAPAVWSPPHSAATVAPLASAATHRTSSAADAAASPPMSIATAAAGAHARRTPRQRHRRTRRRAAAAVHTDDDAAIARQGGGGPVCSVRVVLKFSGAGMPPAAEMGGEQPAPYATDARNDNGKRPRPIEAGTGGTDGADALDNTSPQTCGKRQAPKHQFLLAAGACTP